MSALAACARPLDVDFVVAAEARGFILGAALARELGVGFVPARKPGQAAGGDGLGGVHPRVRRRRAGDARRRAGRRRARAAARRPAGHGRDRAGAVRARRGRGRGGRRLRASWSSCRSSAGARSSRRTTSTRSIAVRLGVRREQVFWGWGEPGAGPVAAGARRRAAARGARASPAASCRAPVALEDVRAAAVGAAGRRSASGSRRWREVRDDREARVLRCRGKSYLDLLAQRAGDCASAPDAVVAPARRRGGGGGPARRAPRRASRSCRSAAGRASSAGWRASAGAFDALISLDLGRLDRVLSVDARSRDRGLRARDPAARGRRRAARARARARARAAELRVGDGRRVRGDALGRADLDRARAHRRAGRGARVRDAGRVAGDARRARARAAGPSLRELVLGSEGALRRDHARRAARAAAQRAAFDGWTVGSFLEGAELLRTLEQDGIAPDIARLSDEEETRAERRAGRDGRGSGGGCSTAAACSSAAGRARHGRAAAARALVRGGARPLGPKPGRAWETSRFAGPHLRDDLLDRGVLVETLETATSWSNLERSTAPCAARCAGFHVGCHVSHLYPSGASLYFTVLGRQSRRSGRAVARGQGRGHARDRRRRRHDHPPPRDRPRPRAVPAATRSASSGSSCCARSRSAATRPGS